MAVSSNIANLISQIGYHLLAYRRKKLASHRGYLLEGGYLNIEDVSVEFHYWILHVWADARKLIKSEQAENAIYYEFFEKMVNRLLEYDRP